MWGQRNTVHFYAADDWPFLHRWIRDRSVIGSILKQAGVERSFNELVQYCERRLEQGDRLTFKDVSSFEVFRSIVDTKERWPASKKGAASPDWLIAAAAIMR